MNFFKSILRFGLILLVLGYFVSATALLITRYWVLPRVDEWRPDIEAVLTESLGAPVKIGAIDGQWRSLSPVLSLRDLSVLGEDGEPNLVISAAQAIVSWRSLLHLEPVFSYIGVSQFELTAVKQTSGLIRLAGFEIDLRTSTDSTVRERVLRWLSKQGRVDLTQAKVTWVDQEAGAPPLTFRDIGLSLDNQLLSHRLDFEATLPTAIGDSLAIAIEIDRLAGTFGSFDEHSIDAEVFLTMPRIDIDAIKPWLALPEIKGVFGGRAWVKWQDGLIDTVTADLSAVSASGVQASIDSNGEATEASLTWQAGQAEMRVSGPLGVLWNTPYAKAWVIQPPASARLAFDFEASDLLLNHLSADLDSLAIDAFKVDSVITRPSPGGLSVTADNFSLANRDGLIQMSGQWQRNQPLDGDNVDIEGTLARFDLTALPRYLSGAIGQETAQWMSQAFKRGMISQAGFKVKGPVADFPYAGADDQGVFTLDGSFQGWSLDYAPPEEEDGLGWPPLVDLKGSLSMVKDRISVRTDAGALQMPQGERVAVTRLSASLTDLIDKPVLSIQAQTTAPAKAYLALLKQTALKDLTPSFVNDLSGRGQWALPLTLQMDISDVDKTSFRVALDLNGGEIGYASLPRVIVNEGTAVFTENGFTAQGLVGSWLGREITVSGGINESTQTVSVKGGLSWSSLAKATEMAAISPFVKGQLPFELDFEAPPNKPQRLRLTSSLKGTEILLPKPFAKAADTTLPLTLTWQDGSSSAPGQALLKLGSLATLEARMAGTRTDQAPLFDAVAVSIGQTPIKLKEGFTAAARFDVLQAEPWLALYESLPTGAGESSAKPSLFPALGAAKISAQQFKWSDTVLDAFDVDYSQDSQGQNHLALKSNQTSGTVRWQGKDGNIDGQVLANFSKFNIGSQHKEALTEEEKAQALASLPKNDALSEIPALDLTIDELTVFGSTLGKLEVVGKNSPDHTQWNIESLNIKNPHGEVQASGVLRFSPNPGLSGAVALNLQNLGEMTDSLGLGKRIRNGSGQITAKVDWADFPWQTDYDKLNTQVAIDLKNGVFDGLGSSSARVLELLSLQSLNRLFQLDLSVDNSFKEGFPWQRIVGDMSIASGVADTRNLTVSSAVATIAIEGGANIVDETWGLHAEVKPNLDMSGTAIASGFVVNPLVGLTALIGQYLLRNPVEKALAVNYAVTGSWDRPIINGEEPKESNTANEETSNSSDIVIDN